ncbi:MAG TPA: hypothetical protein VJZ00_16840, partial [Thermoanaerobaculia bacterium]|nr:hypothetical protein [Thermoanaerobaculia bacterium]
MRSLALVLFLSFPALAQSWTQWGAGPRHTGALPVYGQPLAHLLADIEYDPFVGQERQEAGGSLLVHYQTPLSDGNDVFMEVKGGTYTEYTQWQSQTWSIRKFSWQNGTLVTKWTATSDWDPVPPGAARFEPVFHAALANGFLYMAGAGGTVLEIDRATGAQRRRLGPFGETIDPTIYVIGPITADDAGNLYYNALKLPATSSWVGDHQGAWLVKITPSGVASRVTYQELVPSAPAANAQCLADFTTDQQPWPPSPTAVPRSITCGSQRSGLNVAPAVGPDGTIYTVSRAHLNSRWSWLVAVNPDLTPKWSASLRNLFNDGCGVLLLTTGQPGTCRPGANIGVDPSDNMPGSGTVNDSSTSSPVVAPDGSIYYGTYTRYNHAQGHTVRFSATGAYLGFYKFGWDVTPAIWAHDGTFSVITKENRYEGTGPRVAGDEEGYFITQLSPALNVEWRYASTNTEDDHPVGYEWCVN